MGHEAASLLPASSLFSGQRRGTGFPFLTAAAPSSHGLTRVMLFEAIFAAEDVPDEWQSYTKLNEEMAPKSPHIDAKKDPMPGCPSL